MYIPTLKREEILAYATTAETWRHIKINWSSKDRHCESTHIISYEGYRVIKFIDTGSRMKSPGPGEVKEREIV